MKVDGPVVEKWSLGYLIDTIYLRDAWMHRVDVTRATGAALVLTPDHDGRIVADVVAEWARRHGQPFTLHLTGPAGGTFTGGRPSDRRPGHRARRRRVLPHPRRTGPGRRPAHDDRAVLNEPGAGTAAAYARGMLTLRPLRLLALVSSLALVGGLAVAGATGATAASPSKKDTTLIVRDLPAQVRLVPGEKVKIILQTNLTTGYTWKADGGCCTRVRCAGREGLRRRLQGSHQHGRHGRRARHHDVDRHGPATGQDHASRSSRRRPVPQNTMNDETVGTLKLIVMPK